MVINVGTSGYSYKEWRGTFYPEKISPKEMLHAYSAHFGTVEINNTFYRMPTETILSGWADQVPDGFLFAFKAPQVITHIKRLKNVASPSSVATRSKCRRPTSPQLSPPTSSRTPAIMSSDFIVVFLSIRSVYVLSSL